MLIKKQAEREEYQKYIAEAARLTLENVAKLRGRGAAYLEVRYADIIAPKPENPRTEEEIIEQIRRRGWGGEKHKSV